MFTNIYHVTGLPPGVQKYLLHYILNTKNSSSLSNSPQLERYSRILSHAAILQITFIEYGNIYEIRMMIFFLASSVIESAAETGHVVTVVGGPFLPRLTNVINFLARLALTIICKKIALSVNSH